MDSWSLLNFGAYRELDLLEFFWVFIKNHEEEGSFLSLVYYYFALVGQQDFIRGIPRGSDFLKYIYIFYYYIGLVGLFERKMYDLNYQRGQIDKRLDATIERLAKTMLN